MSIQTHNHFTLPYYSWSNGAMERLGRKIIRTKGAVPSELQLSNKMWPNPIPIV